MHLSLADLDRAFIDNELAAAALVNEFSDDLLNRRPDEGNAWSIAQCLDHLAISNRRYTEAMLPAVSNASPGVSGKCRPGFFGNYFIGLLEPPVTMRGRAPAKLHPIAKIAGSEVMMKLRQSHRDIANVMAALAGKNPNAIRFRNPLLPGLRPRISTGLIIIAAHERRHLWQANNISAWLRSRL